MNKKFILGLIFSLLTFNITAQSFKISGSSVACSSINYLVSAEYQFPFFPPFFMDRPFKIEFTVKVDGITVITKKYDLDHKFTPEKVTKIFFLGNIPSGNFTVDATLFYLLTRTNFPVAPVVLKSSISGFSGIPDFAITGKRTVCPNEVVEYSIPLSNAKSYKWTVPQGWEIIGSSTNEVITTSNKIQVRFPSCPVATAENDNILPTTINCNGLSPNNGVISAQALSSNCGQSNIIKINVNVDRRPTLEYSAVSNTNYKVVAKPNGLYNYRWQIPSNWQLVSESENKIEINPFGAEGFVSLIATTSCGVDYSTRILIRKASLPNLLDPELEFDDNLMAYPNPTSQDLYLQGISNEDEVFILSNTTNSFQKLNLYKNQNNNFYLNGSDLPSGVNILLFKKNGKDFKRMRIIKN